MFGLGFGEIVIILLVILLVFGPDKIPELSRNFGKAMGIFKRTMDEVRDELHFKDLDKFSKTDIFKPESETAAKSENTTSVKANDQNLSEGELPQKELSQKYSVINS